MWDLLHSKWVLYFFFFCFPTPFWCITWALAMLRDAFCAISLIFVTGSCGYKSWVGTRNVSYCSPTCVPSQPEVHVGGLEIVKGATWFQRVFMRGVCSCPKSSHPSIIQLWEQLSLNCIGGVFFPPCFFTPLHTIHWINLPAHLFLGGKTG